MTTSTSLVINLRNHAPEFSLEKRKQGPEVFFWVFIRSKWRLHEPSFRFLHRGEVSS